MEERMRIFWAKYHNEPSPWTKDDILRMHKFTNVYRSCDRVSQYLIKKVIYSNNLKEFSEEDILFRILIFKIFNRIDTWEFLESEMGFIKIKDFNFDKAIELLTNRIKYFPIFSSAYLMTASGIQYSTYESKHERLLRMIQKEFLKDKIFQKILKSKSLEEIYNLLVQRTFLGEFLGYQYAIDFNYSPVINFDENSFVKAGVGAIRGIIKCFEVVKRYNYDDIIRFTYDNLSDLRVKYGYNNFVNLFGREPSLIDLQNCFCETDKYLRVKMPELKVKNVRIKHKYFNNQDRIEFFFPPKWNIKNRNI